jgi:triosephosphate isomerase
MIQFSNMKKSIPLVVGNWKLNPGTATEAVTLAKGVAKAVKKSTGVEVVVAPPYIFIPEIAKALKNSSVQLSAQDIHFEERGACTGEVSTSLLAPYGVTLTIIGHSERRALGETDEQVQKKIVAALKRKFTPIVCVGERERDGQGNFYSFVEDQIRSLATGLKPVEIQRVVIAYEPIWAIGTGRTATVEDVKEMQLFIMSVLAKLYDRKVAAKVMLLYGGSVKPSNALELHQQGGMQGFLVGGASLTASDFGAIIKSVTQ